MCRLIKSQRQQQTRKKKWMGGQRSQSQQISCYFRHVFLVIMTAIWENVGIYHQTVFGSLLCGHQQNGAGGVIQVCRMLQQLSAPSGTSQMSPSQSLWQSWKILISSGSVKEKKKQECYPHLTAGLLPGEETPLSALMFRSSAHGYFWWPGSM